MWNGVDMKKTAGLDTIRLNGSLVKPQQLKGLKPYFDKLNTAPTET